MRNILLGCVVVVAGCSSHSSTGGVDAPGTTGDSAIGGGDAPVATIAVTIANAPMTPATFDFLVAYQDGSGAWTLAPAPTGDVYAIPNTSGRYGIAWTCVSQTGALREVAATYSTTAEHPSLTIATVPDACTDRTTVALVGAVTGRATGAATPRYIVSFGDASADVGSAGNYALKVAPGTHDLIVTESPAAVAVDGGTADNIVDKVYVHRGLAVTAAGSADVDFTTAVAITSFPVTATVTGTPRVVADTTLYAGGTIATLVHDGSAAYETEGLGSNGVTSDVYAQAITVTDGAAAAAVSNVVSTPAAQTYSAPAELGGAIVTTAAETPYPQLKTTWTAYANAISYGWVVEQPLTTQCGSEIAACEVAWTATMSAGWIGSTTAYQMPDLSALGGWNAELALTAGVATTGTVDAVTSTAGETDFPLVTPPVVGTQRAVVTSSWTATP